MWSENADSSLSTATATSSDVLGKALIDGHAGVQGPLFERSRMVWRDGPLWQEAGRPVLADCDCGRLPILRSSPAAERFDLDGNKAHLMLALCRAINIPTRFTTGIDYRADPALGPTDFHAYVEVYLGDRWYMFDPSGTAIPMGFVRFGTGRDAADVDFATIFGSVTSCAPRISFEAIAGADGRLVMPYHCAEALFDRQLACLLLGQCGQQFQLLRLDLQQFPPLLLAQRIELVVQQHDFQLGLEIDFVVVFRGNSVLLGLPVL